MADTTYITKVVEPYIRSELAKEFGVPFEKRILHLITGGTHEFDAVSDDLQIVGAIKTAGGKTVSGKNPSGKIKGAEADIRLLTIVSAANRMLVLTFAEFHQIMEKRLIKRPVPGIYLKLIELPEEMREKVEEIQRKASSEVSGPSK